MPDVFHRGRDEGKKHPYYYFNLLCADGKRRQFKAFTDKAKSEQLAAKRQHEEDLRRRGLIDPHLEKTRQREMMPLPECLKEFEKKLAKTTPKYRKLVVGRARRVMEACGFTTPAEINAETVETVLRELATEEDLGARTYNHYLQACHTFTKWLWKTGRRSADPLISLEPLNSEVDIRHKRRALSAEEVAKLVQSARDSGVEIQCFDGETRARIYQLSYMTGFRKKELASLTPSSFALTASPPTVTVEAKASKNRKRSVLPLHPELVPMLRKWLKGMKGDQHLFPNLDRRRGYLMVRKDLERVGIAYKTEDGIADFHAAGRHTHITELLRNGASLPEVKELARHSDVRQTMKYTHIGLDDQAKAIRRLPWHHIGTGSGDPTRPALSTRDTNESRGDAGSPDTETSSAHTKGVEKSRCECGQHRSTSFLGFDSRRLHSTRCARSWQAIRLLSLSKGSCPELVEERVECPELAWPELAEGSQDIY